MVMIGTIIENIAWSEGHPAAILLDEAFAEVHLLRIKLSNM
jgi:hypothetical protein